MFLDPRTIFFALSVLTFISGAVILVVADRGGRDPGGIGWGAGLAVMAVGQLLLVLRGLVPIEVSVLAGNAIVLLGLALIVQGTARAAGRPFLVWLYAGLIGVSAVAGVWFLFVEADVNMRTAVASCVLAVTGVDFLRLLPRALREVRRRLRWFVIGAVVTTFVIAVLRGFSVVVGSRFDHMFESTLLNVTTLLGFFLSIGLWSAGLVIVVVTRGDRLWLTSIQHAENLASHDPLTGTFNRRGLEAAAARVFAVTDAQAKPVGAVVFDIDHFKRVNDSHGHAVGDLILVGVADVAREQVRAGDVLARLGGEEFAMLLADTDLDGAAVSAKRLRLALEAHAVTTAAGPVPVTCSFGVAQRAPGEALDALLQRADAAMYRAKAEGRNRVVAG